MAYTKLEKIRFNKLYKSSLKIDDDLYLRIINYKPEELTNNIFFELHLRIDEFKELYDKYYLYINDQISAKGHVSISCMKTLSYEDIFKKYGYNLGDIKIYIMNSISLVKKQIKYKKENLYISDASSPNEYDFYRKNKKTDLEKKEYDLYMSDFDIYSYEYFVPTSKYFNSQNSINVNIMLNPKESTNILQLENILNLIREKNDVETNISKLLLMSQIKISLCFYIYDLNKQGIPESFIKEFTKIYIDNKEQLFKNNTAEIKSNKEINNIITEYNKFEKIKITTITKYIEIITNSISDIIL